MRNHRPLHPTALLLLLVAYLAPPLAADVAVRLTDLEAGDDDGLNGLDAAVLDGSLYFVGSSPAGSGLYRYDGVSAPALVAGSEVADPEELVAWNGKLYFRGGPSGDRELWSYDPAAPSFGEVVDVRPSGNAQPQRFAAMPDRLCFGAFTDSSGFELACWDGSPPALIFDLVPNSDSSFPEHLTAWSGGLAFTAGPGGDPSLYVYDGVAPPAIVEPGPGEPFSGPAGYAASGDAIVFEAQDGGSTARVFRYDGVSPPQRVSTTFSPWGFSTTFRGRLVLNGDDPALGLSDPELLRRGPTGIARMSPGVTIVGASTYSVAAGGLYFVAYPSTSSNDATLFRYCGAGQVAPATAAFASGELVVDGERAITFDGRIFVAGSDADFGSELWALTPGHILCDDFESGDFAAWP
jgi:hypothetical protein